MIMKSRDARICRIPYAELNGSSLSHLNYDAGQIDQDLHLVTPIPRLQRPSRRHV